MEDTMLQT